MIGATKGRFFSLTAIVTIGVAFFVGVSSSSSVMSVSVDKYDDDLNLKDISIYSNYGFDEEDLQAVQNVSGVDTAELTKFVDVIGTADTSSVVTRVHSYRSDSEINQFALKAGRLPENANECVAEAGSDLESGFTIGSTIAFSRPDNDLSDYVSVKSCKVVGLIDTPLYLDEVKENSTLSNQYINTYVYLPEEDSVTDYYTEINVLLTDAKAYNSFSDKYETYAKEEKEKIEEAAKTQQNHRYEIVVSDAQQKYQDGADDYQKALEEYNAKISDAQQQIDENRQTILDGEQALADASQTLTDSQVELDAGYAEGAQKLKDARTQLDQSSADLAAQKTAFAEKEAELNQNIKDIDDGTAKIDSGIASVSQAKTGIQQLQSMKAILSQSNTVLAILSPFPDTASIQDAENAIQASQSLTEEQKQQQQQIALINGSKIALETVFSTKDQPVSIQTAGQFKTYLNNAISQQTVLQSSLDGQIASIYKNLNDGASLSGTEKEISSIEGLDAYTESLQSSKQDLLKKRQEIVDGIASGKQQLSDAETKISDGYAEADQGSAALEQQTIAAQAKINAGWDEINTQSAALQDGRTTLEEAQAELAKAKTEGQQKLDDAKSELDKAKQDIDDLAQGEWTVLDRTQHYSSAAYKNTIKQMSAIAAVFPVFFFMVATLVCLTTMTRMVDEQRGQIGIMRALGYSQRQCAEKYLIYSEAATLIGGILGSILGMMIFPGVIYNAWKMMYILPTIQLDVSWPLVLFSIASFLGVMLLTTWYACHEDMKEVSAQLMRPKSPKLGKSTLIEKIPFIWKHLSFTWKVTVRNLIRYKKRFFMSVFGVAGCTALIITGFGIRDSIQTIATKQFEDIYQYNGTVSFNEDLSASEINDLYQSYTENDLVDSSALLTAYSGKAYTEDNDETVNMQVFDQSEDASVIYHLKVRETQESLTLSDDGIIINEKLAENLKKKVGDTLTIESKDGVRKEVKISGICEMYVRHYVFMTKTYYREIFGVSLADNTAVLKLNGTAEQKKAFQSEQAEADSVKSIEFFDTLLENFNQMIKGLDIIVIVLILSSASLAGVVLGNLTNVNISERMREIATLKVLGFRQKEVENYIYKENNVLTLIGSLVGIPLGMMLHYYIMHQVEMDYVMFGRKISALSCVICVAMTLGFGFLVNLFMAKHLRKIQMVESLKSVE